MNIPKLEKEVGLKNLEASRMGLELKKLKLLNEVNNLEENMKLQDEKIKDLKEEINNL